MNDQQFNNNFFTEENSPVPLIPIDDAWENMQAKLDSQLPQKKKRRMLLWLPPVGCALVLLLLLGGGYGLWQYTARQPLPAHEGQHRSNSSSAVARPRNDKPADTPARYVQPNNQLLNNDTVSLSRTITKKEKPFSVNNTTALFKRKQRNGVLSTTPDSLRHKQSLLEKDNDGLISTSSVNVLRPSPLAGVHYEASIHVQPGRALKPLCLSEGSSQNGSSGMQPASKFVFAMGLQVEVPVPIYLLPDVYFKDPEVKDRFYQPLSPGIWGSISRARHRITAEFKPFASALLPNKTFLKNALIMPDNSVLLGDKKLVKVFGTQAGLQYTYQVKEHWWAGAGVDVSLWRKALILSEGLDSTLTRSRMRGIHKNDASFLNASQVGGVLHLAYESKAWTGMLQIGAPFQPTVKDLPVPVWVRLGVRLRLLQSRNSAVNDPLNQVRCPL